MELLQSWAKPFQNPSWQWLAGESVMDTMRWSSMSMSFDVNTIEFLIEITITVTS